MKPRRTAGDGTPLDVSPEEQLVDALFDVMVLMREHFTAVVSEVGLQPPLAHALRHLRPGHTVAMGVLADELHLDASTITGIVDRLEHEGLVARRADPRDRRVKALAVTEQGAATRNVLCERLRAGAPPIAALTPDERDTLHQLLTKIIDAAGGPPATRPTVRG